jgi:hypothetical protein
LIVSSVLVPEPAGAQADSAIALAARAAAAAVTRRATRARGTLDAKSLIASSNQ